MKTSLIFRGDLRDSRASFRIYLDIQGEDRLAAKRRKARGGAYVEARRWATVWMILRPVGRLGQQFSIFSSRRASTSVARL